jgi:hypothetical protein
MVYKMYRDGEIDFTEQNVLIIWRPASGKTYLANQIKTDAHIVIHTDDYKWWTMWDLLDAIHASPTPSIIEWIAVYKFLSNLELLWEHYPHIILDIKITPQHQAMIYHEERDASKLEYVQKMNKKRDQQLKQMLILGTSRPVRRYIIDNNFTY